MNVSPGPWTSQPADVRDVNGQAIALVGLSVGGLVTWRSHVRYYRLAPRLQITNGRLALLRMLARTDALLLVAHASLLYIAVRSFHLQVTGWAGIDHLWDIPLARIVANATLLIAQWRTAVDRRQF